MAAEAPSSHRLTTSTRQPVMHTTLQLRSGESQERGALLRAKSTPRGLPEGRAVGVIACFGDAQVGSRSSAKPPENPCESAAAVLPAARVRSADSRRPRGPSDAQFEARGRSSDASEIEFRTARITGDARARWPHVGPLHALPAQRCFLARRRSPRGRRLEIAIGEAVHASDVGFQAPIEGLRVSRLATGEPPDVALSTTARAAGSGGSPHIR